MPPTQQQLSHLTRPLPAAPFTPPGRSRTGSDGGLGDPRDGRSSGRRFLGQYELLGTLGKGMSGKVKKATNVVTGECVALKIIDKSKAARRTLMQLHTEVMALRSLRHPNILQLLHVELEALYPKKSGEHVPSIVLALQLAGGGELFDFMMFTGHFSEVVSRTLFRQLMSALAYCHERGVYHRDIKPENLLLDDKFQLKIADFGLAAIRSDPDELLRTECGTRSYMAPEILAHREYDGGKADVWSSGVVLFILLAGNPPFQLAKKGDWWFNAVSEGDYDRFWRAHKKYAPHIPPNAQVLLTSIFQPDPELRSSSYELMQAEWMRGTVLSPSALYREMSSRRAEVQREKDRERERAKAEKLQAAALGGSSSPQTDESGSCSAYYDPFTRERQRSVDANAAPISDSSNNPHPLAPTLAGGACALRGLTHFYTPLSYPEVLSRLHAAMGTHYVPLSPGISAKKGQEGTADGSNRLHATLPIGGAKVKVEASVWEDDGVLVVDVQRREGDPLLFHRAYARIRSKVESRGVCEEPVALSPSSLSSHDAEEPITDDLDMI